MASGLNDLLFETHEHWQSDGPPRETYLGAGQLFLELDKPKADWGGTGIAKNPQRSKLSGNGGANFSKVRTASTPSGGVQFLQPIAEHWEVLQVSSKFLELLKDPSYLESGMDGLMDEMEQKVTAYTKQASYLLWGDGRGAVGRGDGAYTISGNTITLRNKNSARCFEVGDVLRFAITATYEGTPRGTVSAVRDGTITVTKVNETEGKIVVSAADISVAIGGATNADYIIKDSYVGAESPILTGIFTWLARTNTLANGTVYGVDCSVYPERLAGRRVPVGGNDSPWTICSKIMREATNAGARGLNRIYVPSSEIDKLMEEMASRNIAYQLVDIGVDKPANLRMVVSGVEVGYGGIRAVITVDPFLIDHSVTAANDRTYVGLTSGDWALETTQSAIGWKDYKGVGSYLDRDVTSQMLQAEYGMYGNLACFNNGHQIVAAVGAES